MAIDQCENGSLACRVCINEHLTSCYSCKSSYDAHDRCINIEKILISLEVQCQYKKYGCRETVSFCEKVDHEEQCLYIGCSCPIPGCNFVSSSNHLYAHFRKEHHESANSFCYNSFVNVLFNVKDKFCILHNIEDDNIFVMEIFKVENVGSAVTVSLIGPRDAKQMFLYDLEASTGSAFLRLSSANANTIQSVTVAGRCLHPSMDFLLIPYSLSFSSSYLVTIEIKPMPR